MMFGLTKREQRWAAEQKAAETLIPLAITAIEARVAMDTNIDRIAALKRDLAQAVQMYTDAAGERDKALADLAAIIVQRDEALIAESKAIADLATAKAQLPAEMQECTIVFKECENGHGWLTATNWVQHGCPTCELAAAQAERDDANKECGFRIGERDEARAERDKWKAMAEWLITENDVIVTNLDGEYVVAGQPRSTNQNCDTLAEAVARAVIAVKGGG